MALSTQLRDIADDLINNVIGDLAEDVTVNHTQKGAYDPSIGGYGADTVTTTETKGARFSLDSGPLGDSGGIDARLILSAKSIDSLDINDTITIDAHEWQIVTLSSDRYIYDMTIRR